MTESYSKWVIVSLSTLPSPLLYGALVLLIIMLGVAYWGYRGGGRRGYLLFTLRVIAAVLVAILLWEPAIQLRWIHKRKNRLAVIVDHSQSMNVSAGTAKNSRFNEVKTILSRSTESLKKLAEDYIIEWYDLDGLRSSSPDKATGERTDIVTALENSAHLSTKPLAGIVLFSDGADHLFAGTGDVGSLGGRLNNPSVKAEEIILAKRITALGAAVNVVAVAAQKNFFDVLVKEMRGDEFAFLHNTFHLQVTVASSGFKRLTMPVILRRDGKVIATEEVTLQPGIPTVVDFSTKPEKIGEFVYSAEIMPQAGEAVTANNQRFITVQVIRDKIRVLHVAGRPSWDERFLRQHLKENPNVDLISFFILRTPSDEQNVPEEELSLIPFPVQKLFTTELASFDIVILQNFDYAPYGMSRFLPNIAQAVRGGLGFVMLGGDQSFGKSYRGTAIEDLLPLNISSHGTRSGIFRPQLTAVGTLHPITDLRRGGAGNNQSLWSNLPPWRSLNISTGAAKGATVLAQSGKINTGNGQPLPLIAVMEVDKGRSMAIASDSIWRWRLSAHGNGGVSERAFHRFWSNALRWLVKDPEHSRLRLSSKQGPHSVGVPTEVTATLVDPSYQPISGGVLSLTLSRGGDQFAGTSGTIGGQTGEQTGAQTHAKVYTDDAGSATKRYQDLPTGAYHVRGVARLKGEVVAEGETVFVVAESSKERLQVVPNDRFLEIIADASGGQILPLSTSLWGDLKLHSRQELEIDRRRNIELWDNMWSMLLLLSFFVAEWALRRRYGYV